ncbi:MAG: hypothetical protein M3Q12_00205 [Pseudomonadota bacterium]|uniref:PP0621 family protein n=1 Tax=Polaromonas sp. TaxID=1869339 RepID=UPI00182ECC15|nr:PP0621 family protein [Polaromonas sp.]MBA3593563.1 hypothetical protein [Polaromonas sp.]MDQ3270576.1 hypothetical protein [Pseudomonadota bacterium]
MKYLIVFLVVLVGIWLWRNNRRVELRDKNQTPPRPVSGPKQATEVVACAVCAVHLPRPDAVPGKQGLYCSDAHRRQGDA